MKILVLDACALHVGYLGCYGNDWVATPALDRLASQAVVFDQHYVTSPEPSLDNANTSDSAPSDIAGVYSYRLVVPELHDFADQVVNHLDRLAKAEKALLQVDGPTLAPPWRLPDDLLASYFEETEDGSLAEPWPNPPQGRTALTDDDLVRLQNTYAAVATAWDAQLERILDETESQSWAKELVLIITARSGLPLGEHGVIGFSHPWLHEELVHVPLLIRFPAGKEAGRRVGALTQSADLTSAVDALLGVASPQDARLLQLLREDLEAENTEVVSVWRLGQEEEWAARTRDWALLWPRGQTDRPVQLYAKPEDRWEANNLCQHQLDLVEAWQHRLEIAVKNRLRLSGREAPRER